jgi:lipoate-protein ligase A
MAELVHGRHKVAGCAQKRQGGAFLQHGSVPVEMDLDLLCRVLGGEPERAPVQRSQLEDSIGWLNRFSAAPVSLDLLEAAFVETFSRQLGIELQPGSPTTDEQAQAEDLAEKRFADPGWRCGDFAG